MSESKNESISKSENPPVLKNDSVMRAYVGMFWLLWGNIFLAAMALKLSQKQALLSIYDIFYWAIVVLLAITRYCDIRYYKGVTIKGSQATMDHWKKYVTNLLIISVVLWVLAHVLYF